MIHFGWGILLLFIGACIGFFTAGLLFASKVYENKED